MKFFFIADRCKDFRIHMTVLSRHLYDCSIKTFGVQQALSIRW